jgi:hypothetical protein
MLTIMVGSAPEVVALVAEQSALVIARDGRATSGGTYQSDTVLDSAEGAHPPTPRQVARECVREVRAREGREADVEKSAVRPGFDLPFVAMPRRHE